MVSPVSHCAVTNNKPGVSQLWPVSQIQPSCLFFVNKVLFIHSYTHHLCIALAAFDATVSWVIGTETVRPKNWRYPLAFYRKRGFHNSGSKGNACEVPWELQEEELSLLGRAVGGTNLAEEHWAGLEGWVGGHHKYWEVVGNRNPWHKIMRKPGVLQKMTCTAEE